LILLRHQPESISAAKEKGEAGEDEKLGRKRVKKEIRRWTLEY
jgi:hypothetical protein